MNAIDDNRFFDKVLILSVHEFKQHLGSFPTIVDVCPPLYFITASSPSTSKYRPSKCI